MPACPYCGVILASPVGGGGQPAWNGPQEQRTSANIAAINTSSNKSPRFKGPYIPALKDLGFTALLVRKLVCGGSSGQNAGFREGFFFGGDHPAGRVREQAADKLRMKRVASLVGFYPTE